MKKFSFVLLFSLVLLVLTGCGKDIPDGPIKDFVDKLDYNLAYQHVVSGKSETTVSYYIDDTLDGQLCTKTYIDKSDSSKYQYMITDISGSYHASQGGEYAYNNQQTLCYLNSDDTVSVYKKTDGVLEDIKYTPEDVQTSINNFYYTELESGYHRGGVYYGDYVKANCANYYSCFSLNEEGTELTYQVNTSTYNTLDEEIVTMHKFTIDEYGMIKTLSTKAIMLSRNIVIETITNCFYNIKIEKLTEL